MQRYGYYTIRQVCELTTLSVPTIWRLRQDGKFPEPEKLSPRRVGWRRHVIEKWISDRQIENSSE